MFAAGLLGAIVILVTGLARATTYTVGTIADDSGDSKCSLRDAINAANGHPSAGSGCTTQGTGNDAITFSVTGQINLNSTLPEITDRVVSITGPSQSPGITIDGGGKFQLMQVASSATVNLQQLTFADGTIFGSDGPSDQGDGDGGAILNHGTLIVTNATFSTNHAAARYFGYNANGGAIFNDGTLRITNGTFSANETFGFDVGAGPSGIASGGAIFNAATLVVTNSTFSANQAFGGSGAAGRAGQGGAIFNQATATIIGSTFSSNKAIGGTGDLLVEGGQGGAIFSTSRGATTGVLSVTNSTFSANQAIKRGTGSVVINPAEGGAIYADIGVNPIINSTFSANQITPAEPALGGTFFSTRTLTLKGTILATNPGGNCGDLTKITDNGYNLSDDASCHFTATGSKNSVTNIDLASMLASNGGPTQTLALTSTASAAVNQIPPADCLATDQRGYERPAPNQTNCDIGAFELGAQPAPPITVDCSNAVASSPSLTASSPTIFFPEDVNGVTDTAGPFTISITGVREDKPVAPLLCPNANVVGTTTFVRLTTAPLQGPGGLLYGIEFKATDKGSGRSCTGSVPVCVQDLIDRGKPCAALPLSYDATKCP